MFSIHTLELKLPPLLLAGFLALLMWAIARLFPAATLVFPASVWLGVLVCIVGFCIALAGVMAFRRARTTVDPRYPAQTTQLVRSGIYRYSRNPMYLGFLLALLGWAVVLAHGLAWLLLPVFVVYMNRFQIEPEERFMGAKFGAEFDAYQRAVRRWI